MANTEPILKTHTDEQGRRWLESAVGEAESLWLPRDIYGIRRQAFCDCKNLKTVMIPSEVEEIEENAFAGFGNELCIHCEAETRPEGWFYEESCLESFSEDYEMYFRMEVYSWIGRYHYTCDSDDKVTTITMHKPKVRWNSDRFSQSWQGYGEYFMNRTVADIMEEWSEAHDEWRPATEKDNNENGAQP